jgi:superfamily II DNA/RNA helicase
MADMGFLPAVRHLIDMTSTSRQTLLFSATLDGPVDKLVRDYQRDPARHEVEPTTADQGEVQHHFWRVESGNRVAVTAELIHARGPAIVFCRTKRGADRLSDRLGRSGIRAAAIHGDRSQAQRERALATFQAGRVDVLVATDIAARGIHVDAVPLVVHFDPPADSTDYLHRSGRTGRAGADGLVVSLVGNEHVRGTRLITNRLGLPADITAPDVAALAHADGARVARSPRPSADNGRESGYVAQAPTKRGRVHSHDGPRTPGRRPRRSPQRSGRPERRSHR